MLLLDLSLPKVQEADQGGQVAGAYLQVDQGVGVGAPQEQGMEKLAART